MDGLKGSLLIAGASLFDPNFRRSVILVGEHNEEGALGVVLNRPAPLAVSDVIPALSAATDGRIYVGGPVQPESAVVLAEVQRPDLADILVFGSIGFVTGDVGAEAAAGIVRARVFAGYAGWGPGQLEGELAEDAWIVEPARSDDVFTEDPGGLWSRVLRRKGKPYQLLATMPFDPSAN